MTSSGPRGGPEDRDKHDEVQILLPQGESGGVGSDTRRYKRRHHPLRVHDGRTIITCTQHRAVTAPKAVHSFPVLAQHCGSSSPSFIDHVFPFAFQSRIRSHSCRLSPGSSKPNRKAGAQYLHDSQPTEIMVKQSFQAHHHRQTFRLIEVQDCPH